MNSIFIGGCIMGISLSSEKERQQTQLSKSEGESQSKSLSNKHDLKPKDDFVLLINPQGVLGKRAVEFMNYPGTTCLGGQIPYVLNLGKALSSIPKTSEPTKWQLVKEHFHKSNTLKARIASQRVMGAFGDSFSKRNELEGKFGVKRFYIDPKHHKYVDKESLDKSGKNEYYDQMKQWADTVADRYVDKKQIPGKIVLNYWDSYVAYSNMLQRWSEKGVEQRPHAVAIPHSLGYRKLVSMIKDEVSGEIAELKKNEKQNGSKDVDYDKVARDLIHTQLLKLVKDEKYMFPVRILSERLMFSQNDVKGSLNSQKELQEQLLTGPYTLPFKDYRSVEDNKNNITVTIPGIDIDLFGIDKNKKMLPHEKFALDVLKERKSTDLDVSRQDKPFVLALGRLNPDKNFHGLIEAFKNSPELREKSNLLMVINGPTREENVNYVKEMQTLLGENNENEKALIEGKIKIGGFEGSALGQLIHIAKMLKESPELDGKWTALSLPDGKDFAGLQRALGKEKQAVAGLYSFKEPYGLVPFESARCGIPVVCSEGSGAKDELFAAGAKTFDPYKPDKIAEAIVDTFNNFESIRESQLALEKGWDKAAQNLVSFMDSDGKGKYQAMNDGQVKGIDVTDKGFIQDGVELLTKAINDEISKPDHGIFEDIYAALKKA